MYSLEPQTNNRSNAILISISVVVAIGIIILAFNIYKLIFPASSIPSVQQEQSAEQTAENQSTDFLTLLQSDIVSSIELYGKVTKVDGQRITVSSGEKMLEVLIDGSAAIQVVQKDAAGKTTAKVGASSDITVDKQVSIQAKLFEGNSFIGYGVVILP